MRRHLLPTLVLVAILAVTFADDPVETKITAETSHANALLGHAVALDGDTLVVGAPNWGPSAPTQRGGAFVYERGESGWEEVAFLERSHANSGDNLGKAVALRGDLLFLGAPGFISSKGAVHAYRRVDGAWVADDFSFSLPGGSSLDSFGSSVAIYDDDTVIVGASGRDEPAGDESGAVYVFDWELDFENYYWNVVQKLTASDGGEGDGFGHRIAIDGDTLVVTAPLHWVEGTRSGAAYVFRREEGEWVEKQKLTPSYATYKPEFGQSVDIDGDLIVVGAPRQVVDDQPSVGLAFVYRWNGETWEGEQSLGSPDQQPFRFFGISCAVSGDLIIVGEDDDTNQTPGRAYVYERPESYWWLAETLSPSDGETGDRFGIAVAIDDTTAVVGADSDEDRTGAVYVYEGLENPAEPPPPPPAEAEEGFLLPARMELAPPAGKKASPGTFTAAGTADLGGVPPDLSQPGTLTVGARTFPVPGLTETRGGKSWVHEGDGLSVEFRPVKVGGSRAKFALAVAGLLPGDVPLDGEVAVGYSVNGLDVDCRVALTGGVFKLGKTPGGLMEPAFCPLKMKAKLKGESRDSLKFVGALGGDGTVPDPSLDVSLKLGESFTATAPAADFVRRGDKLIFKGDAGGIRKLVLDYAKRRVTVTAKRVDLGTIAEGPAALTIEIAIGTDARAVEVLAVRKGASLKY